MGLSWPRVPCATRLLVFVGFAGGLAGAGCSPPPTAQSRYWGPIARAPDASGGGIDDPGGGGPLGGTTDGGRRTPDPDPDPEPEPEPPPTPPGGGLAPPGPTAGRADAGVASASCGMRVTVTTATTGRDYRPRNVGVIFITDAGNRFVKTLAVWADRRVSSLSQWSTITSAAGQSRNRTDAVSGATAGNHNNPRTATWNCTDSRRAPVADGNYRLCFEMTESNRNDPPSRFHCTDFVKGPQAFDRMVPDEPNFRARRLQFTP
jgi:hypothetical protein